MIFFQYANPADKKQTLQQILKHIQLLFPNYELYSAPVARRL